MAVQLLAFGGDNGKKALDELDSVDLQALQLAREWGINGNGHKDRGWTFQRCDRPYCNGALVSSWGLTEGCMLCGR